MAEPRDSRLHGSLSALGAVCSGLLVGVVAVGVVACAQDDSQATMGTGGAGEATPASMRERRRGRDTKQTETAESDFGVGGDAMDAPQFPSPPNAASSWRLLPWGSSLSAAPRKEAPTLELVGSKGEKSPGRVVEILGEADGWWKVRTVDDTRLRGAGIAAPGIEGLDVYALELYVPVGSGTALEADPSLVPAAAFGGKDDQPALDPKPESESLDDARWAQNSYNNFDSYEVPPAPLQGGGEAGKHDTWELDPGSDVFWPDGTLAGAVARAHAFLQPGKPRSTEAGELSCFEVRVGPGKPQAELCFEAQAVHHRQVESVVLAFADKPSNNNTKITKKNAGGFSTAKPTMPTSQVRLRSASSEGIDAEVTRRVVRSHLADVRHCYGVAMHAGLMPEGTLTLWASVDRKGEVIETSARGVDEIFATCVAEKAKDWRFPNGSPGSFSIAMECSLE